jgi:hypothetical protein
MESPVRYYTNGIQIIDVEDPSNPKLVANWWVPGQRKGEEDEYRKWPEHGDKTSFTSLHGVSRAGSKTGDATDTAPTDRSACSSTTSPISASRG